MSTYTDINAALITQLQTVTTLPELVLENARANVNANTAWCRAWQLRAATEAATLGLTGQDRFTGLLQVDLFYPQGQGVATSLTVAEAVLAVFVKGTYLTSNGVTVRVLRSYLETAQNFQAFFQQPVVVEWEAFV
jgi:hypothetical protein